MTEKEIREAIELFKRVNAYLERTHTKYAIENHFRTNEVAIEALERIEQMKQGKGYYAITDGFEGILVTWVEMPSLKGE